MENATYGAKAEAYVARSLRSRGATVTVDTTGPGATDLEAVWSTGTMWLVQVKASRVATSTGPKWPSSNELGRLKSRATRIGATAVVALVKGTEIEFYSARNGHVLTPPDTRQR